MGYKCDLNLTLGDKVFYSVKYFKLQVWYRVVRLHIVAKKLVQCKKYV